MITMIDGVPVYGEPQDNAVEQILRCAKDDGAVYAALMADHHLGYSMPIGGVIAYDGLVSPTGVGYDIACGNKAVRIDRKASEIRDVMPLIMDSIWQILVFGTGGSNRESVDHELFDDPAWSTKLLRPMKQQARAQLGTIGSGNHYVDVFADENDDVWIGVHFGSRGLGHKIATHFIEAEGAKDEVDGAAVLLREDSDMGAAYIEAMNLAGRYAYAGRDWVCDRVARLLMGNIVEEVHNHHNFAWKETHFGRDLWVVRKGATPAFPGQKGFVGGSMGEQSVILEGMDEAGTIATICSTVHGAGRVLSRSAASGKSMQRWTCSYGKCRWVQPFGTHAPADKACPDCGALLSRRQVQVREGLVSRPMMDEWVLGAGVELRGGGTDESPHCYKRLNEVLAHHGDSIRILHTLTPLGVAMAGNENGMRG